MADTIIGGAYLSADRKTWHDASGKTIPAPPKKPAAASGNKAKTGTKDADQGTGQDGVAVKDAGEESTPEGVAVKDAGK